ncbi:DUF4190 domain-containing protein [Streptomyces lavendofoliae]|uniref:Membrane protein n=1 Tax=Streptomyces lavendofoliae TaxID=67314 RepID=A0A918HXG0_9ACTN|nr:DUF4190 domain-containing protein [Streptomyces lavendofoliae]GGU37107.1 membrane protein [Streptomyces lavendofoliae]
MEPSPQGSPDGPPEGPPQGAVPQAVQGAAPQGAPQGAVPQGWPPPRQAYPQTPPFYGAPPPPPVNVNGLSIASLVTGIVCLVPPLGMVLGGVALGQIRKRGERGTGMAVTGMVLSLVSTLLLVAGLATGAFRDVSDGVRDVVDEASRTRSTFELRKGQCFNSPGGVEEAEAVDVTIVDCAEPHDGEVAGGFTIGEFDAWPGDKRIEPVAERRCEELNAAYALDGWAVPDNAWMYYYQPSKESWAVGDRSVTCAFAAEEGKLTGSVRNDEETLDEHQAAFLKRVNQIDAALLEEPEADVEEDRKANVAWAAKVSETVRATAAGLRDHPWPAASRGPVADLAEELEAAGKHWARMAAATDPDTFWEHYEPAYDALPADLGAKARGALKLDVTPPAEVTADS